MKYPEAIWTICTTTGAKPYAGYSGRGMYGAQCWGITCDRATIAEVQAEAKQIGLGRGQQDQLGKGYIVYWPSLEYRTADRMIRTDADVDRLRLQREEIERLQERAAELEALLRRVRPWVDDETWSDEAKADLARIDAALGEQT